jgi:hypothetical protein
VPPHRDQVCADDHQQSFSARLARVGGEHADEDLEGRWTTGHPAGDYRADPAGSTGRGLGHLLGPAPPGGAVPPHPRLVAKRDVADFKQHLVLALLVPVRWIDVCEVDGPGGRLQRRCSARSGLLLNGGKCPRSGKASQYGQLRRAVRATCLLGGLLNMDASTAWSAVGALATVATAAVAAAAARQSRQSTTEANAAATSASEAAETLAAIERDRRHEELTPVFEVLGRRESKDRAELRVELTGGRLESLDEVTVTILDESDREHWGSRLPADVTQDEAEAFVWGAWEFLTAAATQVVSNRQSRPRPYSRPSGKNWDRLPLTATRPGRWMAAHNKERWQDENRGKPVRLLITCRRDGYDPWLILQEVDVPPILSETVW